LFFETAVHDTELGDQVVFALRLSLRVTVHRTEFVWRTKDVEASSRLPRSVPLPETLHSLAAKFGRSLKMYTSVTCILAHISDAVVAVSGCTLRF
jgi:hypothetical protein